MKKRILTTVMFVLMLAALTGVFSACRTAEKLMYKEPQNITFDGSYITWDKVEHANHYMVTINDAPAVRANSTTYTYTSTDEFDVTVTAVFDKTEKSASVTFKPLGLVNTIRIADNGELSWDAVGGANAYQVSVNGTIESTTDTAYTKLSAGNSRVKVKPIVSGDSSFYSFWSDEVNVSIYNAPSKIAYDGTKLTWQGNAPSYSVTVNGTAEIVGANSFEYASGNKDFTVEIKAIGNHVTSFDSVSAVEEFGYLDPVTDVVIEDGIVKWTAIPNAEGYKIEIDKVVQKNLLSDSEYTDLTTGKSHDIRVMPYNNTGNWFSSWSAVKTAYILPTPTAKWNNDVMLDGDEGRNFHWDHVEAAEGYTVRVTKDDKVDTFTTTNYDWANAYLEVGTYKIEVKSTAPSGGSYYDSKYSAPITVRRLPAPVGVSQKFVVSNPDKVEEGFTVNFEQVSGASGYQLYKDGSLLEGKLTTGSALTDTSVADKSVSTEQHYTYMVRSMGGMKTVSGETQVTLPCLSSMALSFDITVQAVPQNPVMEGYKLKWDEVAGNNYYSVSYAGASVTAKIKEIDLSALDAGETTVTVCARGDGERTLASNASVPVTIHRLAAPVNVRITSDGNGTLEWDEVANATGSEVFLGTSTTALDENAYDEMYQFINTNGTTLNMRVTANYYNHDGTLYYMSSAKTPSQQFVRLAAPVFPEGAVANSVELLWNAPTNINTAEYTPTYMLFSAPNEQIGGGVHNGTKFSIAYLEGDKPATFYVKAVGNGTKYLDSELSEVIEVYKLAMPTITLKNNQYVWSGIANASGYYMEIDGNKVTEEFHVSGSAYSFTPRFTTVGEHTVTLKALGDKRTNLDSATFTYKQQVAKLRAPVMEYRYSADSFITNGEIIVNVTMASEHCAKYRYEIAGQTIVSADLTMRKPIQNTGTHSVRVKALGGTFDAEGVYYIDSDYDGDTTVDTITLLAAPAAPFTINSDGAISWKSINGALGYDYQIAFNGGDFGAVTHNEYSSLNPIENHKQYRSITVRVRASGSVDGKVISSAWTEWTWTNSAQ